MDGNGVPASFVILVYLFMLLIWAALGLWGGKIVQGKGYDFWIGFVAGFFGGIVGIIVLYVIKPATRRVEPHAPYAYQEHYEAKPPVGPPRHKVCHACQNLIPGESQFCTYCGADVSGTPAW